MVPPWFEIDEGGGPVGQQAQIKDFNTQKKVFTAKIIFFFNFRSNNAPLAKKHGFLSNLMIYL